MSLAAGHIVKIAPIQEAVRDPLTDFLIDYAAVLREGDGLDGEERTTCLTGRLIDCWIDDHRDRVQHKPYILEVPDRGFNFLFDLTLANYDRNDRIGRMIAWWRRTAGLEGRRRSAMRRASVPSERSGTRRADCWTGGA